jgi:hypothetical protein
MIVVRVSEPTQRKFIVIFSLSFDLFVMLLTCEQLSRERL